MPLKPTKGWTFTPVPRENMITEQKSYNDALFNFIKSTPTAYHCIKNCGAYLASHGFQWLHEREYWKLTRPGKYLVTRNGSLVAFYLNEQTRSDNGFRIIGAHSDSPSLQIKQNQKAGKRDYFLTGVEKYGSPLLATWFDRDLSIAGRVVAKQADGKLVAHLLDCQKPLIVIPSIALHLNRNANEGSPIQVQNQMNPVWGIPPHYSSTQLWPLILDFLKKQHQPVAAEKILGFELFCYDPTAPHYVGLHEEFITAPRLDNLLSCHSAIESITAANHYTNSMVILFNHEEIGSRTESGALSSFLDDCLNRIFPAAEEKNISMRNSFFLSLDNAHATHPNYTSRSDSDHPVILNGGPVIKTNANQRYATNALTSSLLRDLAENCGLKTQDFMMHSDLVSGSTIGPLLAAKHGLKTADVGAATLAMHSIREMTGSKDPFELYRLSLALFERETVAVEGD